MKYLLMIYGNQEKWESMPPEAWPDAIARQEAFNTKYRQTGELLGSYGLAARRTTSLPERRYLTARAARLAGRKEDSAAM